MSIGFLKKKSEENFAGHSLILNSEVLAAFDLMDSGVIRGCLDSQGHDVAMVEHSDLAVLAGDSVIRKVISQSICSEILS